MTAPIQLAGSLIASDAEDRILSYLLLPFGEEGRTSVGRVSAAKGAITIPETLIANMEHDGTRPVARSTSVAETDAGIVATFRVLPTNAGNDLLIEAREGVRTGISVEIDNPTIRSGALVAGELTGAGFVTRPAFPSAQLVACDCGDDPTDTSDDDAALTVPSSEEPTSEADAEEVTQEEEKEVMENTNAAAPADLMVASRGGASNEVTVVGPNDVARMVAAYHESGRSDSTLLAALSDITQTGVFNNLSVPQYIGQLWNERTYQAKYTGLIGHKDLTAMKIVSWKFDNLPVVDDYAGDKASIPSNAVTTSALNETAARLAAGWDVDRIMVDFPNPEFWAAFFAAATDDYSRKIDAKVLTRLKADAVAVTGAGAGPVAKLIKGARALDGQNVGLPTYAIMGWDLYETYLSTTNNNVAVFLSQALGIDAGSFEGFQIVPTEDAGVLGKVLVGTKASHTLFELPGSPIRVDALDIARGGVDSALFGYYAIVSHGKGLVSVA